jgi:RNA polymerase sigma-70 factor (ECF subfamily)
MTNPIQLHPRESKTNDRLYEQQLLEGLLRDDPQCWSSFFNRYDRLIYRCITRVTARFPGVINQEDVREIYANVVVNLLHRDKRKLRTYDPSRGSKLGSWIGLIAINTAYDYLRALSRQPASGSLSEASERPTPTEGPFERVVAREQLKQLARTLRGFSERDRLFVSLYYLEEKDPEEIAKIMGISVKTVYTKKHKLRTRLCQRLGESALAELAA